MKLLALIFSLVFVPSIALAQSDYDCSDFNQENYSHCLHFVIDPPLPSGQGYNTRIYYIDPHGNQIGPMPGCRNSNNELSFYMDNEPFGEWTEIVQIGFMGDDGRLFYEDYSPQTFYHSGAGPASPQIHTVVIDSSSISAPTCDYISSEAIDVSLGQVKVQESNQ